MEELIIQQKVYDMIMYGYPALEQFPKSQKFSLAQDIKKCMDAVMRYVIAANKKYTKKTTLQDLDIEVAALKVYLRMALDLGYLPPKKYEVWSKMAVEVGRMVGGWKKSQQPTLEAEVTDEQLYCSECNESIQKKVYEYSTKTFGAALCYQCQKKQKQ